MPICKNCGKTFPNHIYIDGKHHITSNRKHCLDCIPFKSGLRLKNGILLKKGEKQKPSVTCKLCGRVYLYDYTKGHCLTICNSCNANRKRKNRKIKAVEYKGGCCCKCGYATCMEALEFHHIDDSKKEFALSWMYSLSWDKMKKELDKCALLCSNCHREIHAGVLEL